MIKDITDITRLASDTRIPMLGFGTWKLAQGEEVAHAVSTALTLGYRHIDTAAAYENEKGVGEGIRRSDVAREDIFLTTKCWNDDIRGGYDSVLRACDTSLQELGTDYVDLYLLHWPILDKDVDAWRAMERLLADGKTRAIGVCNYLIHHLDHLLPHAEVPPMVDQIEFHPRLIQPALLTYLRDHDIVVEAWSPLMQGHVTDVPEIVEIANHHGKTPAQIVLRWDLQHKVVTIPKSAKPERIAENADLYDFTLTPEEMITLDKIDENKRFGPDPDNFSF